MADRNVDVFLTLDLKPFIEGLNRAAKVLADAYGTPWLALAERLRRDLSLHQPRPLCIDGHDYHRRRRARKRRNR